MDKVLICPHCESPKVKNKPIHSRECLHCGYMTVRDFCTGNKTNLVQIEEWLSWECEYIPGSDSLASRLEARRIFKENKTGDQL